MVKKNKKKQQPLNTNTRLKTAAVNRWENFLKGRKMMALVGFSVVTSCKICTTPMLSILG